ncbi:metallophosphoesterase family protein [Thalassotalea sp. G2M2-11]|uniref:metallophosphoesterase family protein n=1 Tax=Thalassotalea sp. G2M2-11 TaxID=2787627 RepID=UPI0019D098F4|nr:metallophosphoesterase family protein [Thalassotalea sp. G2M2-11]
MKILAFSDIHNNLDCLQKLIEQTINDSFDLIIIAGDIGDEKAEEFFNALQGFSCPIFYVYGNWDNTLNYEQKFLHNAVHIHQNIQHLNGYHFTGYSGCPANWGKNPNYIELNNLLIKKYKTLLLNQEELNTNLKFKLDSLHSKYEGVIDYTFDGIKRTAKEIKLLKARSNEYRTKRTELLEIHRTPIFELEKTTEYKAYLVDKKLMYDKILHNNKQNLVDEITKADVDIQKTIIITHDRFTYLNNYFSSSPLLHLFGHRHQFNHTHNQGTHFVNVAHLDNEQSLFSLAMNKPQEDIIGNYCILTLSDRCVDSLKVNLK